MWENILQKIKENDMDRAIELIDFINKKWSKNQFERSLTIDENFNHAIEILYHIIKYDINLEQDVRTPNHSYYLPLQTLVRIFKEIAPNIIKETIKYSINNHLDKEVAIQLMKVKLPLEDFKEINPDDQYLISEDLIGHSYNNNYDMEG